MSGQQMSISVTFPGLERQPAPVKSLVNFFMENSSLYFMKQSYELDEFEDCTSYTADVESEVVGDGSNSKMIFTMNDIDAESAGYVSVSGTLSPADGSEVDEFIFDEDEYIGYEEGKFSIQMDSACSDLTGWNSLEIKRVKETEYNKLMCNARNHYVLLPYNNYYNEYSSSLPEYDLRIKYDDRSFEQIEKPTKASAEIKLMHETTHVAAVDFGEEWNDVYLTMFLDNDNLRMGLYNDSESINYYVTPYQYWNNGQLYSDLNDSGLYDFIIFDEGDRNRTYAIDHNKLPITVKLSGAAPDGGTYDIVYELFALCNTVLCKANTELYLSKNAYALSLAGIVTKNTLEKSNYNQFLMYDYVKNFIKVPVTILPFIDGKVNTDKSVMPMIFENEFNSAIVPLTVGNTKYDTQLRTSTFTLVTYDLNREEISNVKDVFYKVGICPFNGKLETRDEIARVLSRQCLEVYWDTYYMSYAPSTTHGMNIRLNAAPWHLPSYYTATYNGYNTYNFIYDTSSFESMTNSIIPTSFISPLVDSETGSVAGLAYFKLCNADGSVFSENDKLYPITSNFSTILLIKPSEDTYITESSLYDLAINGAYLPFTDEKLNGGYVQSVWSYGGKEGYLEKY